jgi:hypothetical protein
MNLDSKLILEMIGHDDHEVEIDLLQDVIEIFHQK